MELAAQDQAQPRTPQAATRSYERWIPMAAVVATVAAVYVGVIQEWARDCVRDPNYNHGFLVPLISGYLIWRRRAELRQARRTPSLLGLVGIFASVALLLLGSAGAEVFTQRVSFVLLLPSLVLFLHGWRAVVLTLFPFALLLLAIPLPYLLYYGLTAPMQAFAAKCAVFGLKMAGVPVMAEGNIIHLSATSLEVAEACSGIRSLYAFLTLGALLAYFSRVPTWVRVLIFLLTIPLSVAGNSVRVFGTGVGVYLAGPAAAEGTIHEVFGMLVIAVSLGVFLLAKKGAAHLWSGRSSQS